MWLNKYEHLRDNNGFSIWTINRAERALRAVQEILDSNRFDHISPLESANESYDSIFKRVLDWHKIRLKIIERLLEDYIARGLVRIEDGWVKSKESVEIKKKLLPNTPIVRLRDISRLRIVTKDLKTLIELTNTLAWSITWLFAEQQFSTYQERKRWNLYPAVFLKLWNEDIDPIFHMSSNPEITPEETLSRMNQAALYNFSTEIQIMTERVREFSEHNRSQYIRGKYRSQPIDFSESNMLILRAVLLDWKEYFAQK